MKKSLVVLSFLIITATAATALGFSLYAYRQMQVLQARPVPKPDDDASMIATIGKVMMLPDEKPTIISVTDRDKLQNQEFFKKALNGDKIIIYEGIRRIILYRPSTGLIVDVAPLVYTTPPPSASPSAAILQTPRPTFPEPAVQGTSSGVKTGTEEQGNFRL
jgi:hypothetical protein